MILDLITNPFRNRRVCAPHEKMGIFSSERSISYIRDDDNSVLGSIQREKMREKNGDFPPINDYLTPRTPYIVYLIILIALSLPRSAAAG